MVIVHDRRGSAVFSVRVQPRSSKRGFSGEFDGSLRIALTSPPVDDAANTECRKLLAKTLGVPRSGVHIVAGQTSRVKKISIEGQRAEDVLERLRAVAPDVSFEL
ncbi:DUF167 domain-containing protein [Prosthecochloris sp. N3]|uniref:UPF0235 protein INT08_00205 n=1 Tax=Prosthecochloris ethylica TaxID=2743976 RepID=A0ABR9XNZ0_9CHLB|nr:MULTISPECIES: DUF167 domain-containing protein [Prosthecochloris]MEC9487360.1 DUF167 domain-containing protein [Prosthecochloris sp.]MBF0585692.1 DUF167 domain-containing protein [Prosthecochloris ethylica]MBF0635602.1 DUF167 domain-containing protein [Prosthecochloris ethylica]NUK46901.1 DUF167 domain-containing protein [Prosthecochloris ethylica]RNA65400.1 DUF167 domain-containing protein [Prosthecochloris sp. ZM_2]